MFEKSLYDLIRGLRNHKGAEKEYIQKSLKECRAEVRSQDMDVKATALLKLVYLEMVGHDMSWASFHVLEVMSSPKYHQKRVGYLGAVQSFRPDTEVLMLATNLLKKDLSSSAPSFISLPVATLPHVITPSLALSTLADLIPRLSHSHANIRKKTLVTLYRLALVYPEALRAAWPKIKERLMDPNEDPSVTAAIVNVVCELGWRRPHDFLPLAPRLFELLVDGGNNWMAIKLIKLFATLTHVEPRLVRKLLPPLTNIIRTTPAMSLLYECINGIIQGGILGDAGDVSGTDEIATLCVNKLRGMVTINGDPNLKYVALLAFNKIVVTHPFLVSQQEDVILECIDSPDITIRIQALDLVQGMVTGDNLITVVSRLLKQLKASQPSRNAQRQQVSSQRPSFDNDEDSQLPSDDQDDSDESSFPLPEDYRLDVIRRILFMCSKDNYANIVDFDWYIDVLTQLVRIAPVSRSVEVNSNFSTTVKSPDRISQNIGDELRSVSVKVRAMRSTAVRACQMILKQIISDTPTGHPITSGALISVVWVIGEFASLLTHSDDTLNSLLQLLSRSGHPEISTTTLHATAKVFASTAGSSHEPWTAERKSTVSLSIARILHSCVRLGMDPNLEVQERAVEFVELLKLTAEAVSGQPSSTNQEPQDPPLLLTQAIPSLFDTWELNSVAPGAQNNVPAPDGLDLDEPIHPDLNRLLSTAQLTISEAEDPDDIDIYYHQRQPPASISSSMAPAISRLADPSEATTVSYQQANDETYLDADIVAKRKAERLERNKDDPFYIGGGGNIPQTSTPIHNILKNSNGPDLDIDSIPIMQLDLDEKVGHAPESGTQPHVQPRQKVVIAADETLGDTSGSARGSDVEQSAGALAAVNRKKMKSGLLQVDSSTIGSFSLEDQPTGGYDHERQQQEDVEMKQAMKEVERLRLEMQRANERIQVAQGVDVEGVVVKKKKKKATKGPDGEAIEAKPKKTKKNVKKIDEASQDSQAGGDTGETNLDTGLLASAADAPIVKKKKKKKASVPALEE